VEETSIPAIGKEVRIGLGEVFGKIGEHVQTLPKKKQKRTSSQGKTLANWAKIQQEEASENSLQRKKGEGLTAWEDDWKRGGRIAIGPLWGQLQRKTAQEVSSSKIKQPPCMEKRVPCERVKLNPSSGDGKA